MNDPTVIFGAMHVFLGICAVVILGLAVWLAYAIVHQDTAAVGHHEVDDKHRAD